MMMECFSVVVRVDDIDANDGGRTATRCVDRLSAGPRREWLELVEVQRASIFGMPLTFLATNLL
jgi:hypothetical protein